MDYKSPFDEQTSQFENFELHVNAEAQGFLRETAKWASFISIVAFIWIGLMVLFSLFFIINGQEISNAQRGAGAYSFSGTIIGLVYLIFSGIAIMPALYLSKFAGKMKAALDAVRTDALTAAFENLKSHFKTVGIITIVCICLFLLSFIFTIIAGIGAAAGAF
jgi:Family of unknown function (DUF5362)